MSVRFNPKGYECYQEKFRVLLYGAGNILCERIAIKCWLSMYCVAPTGPGRAFFSPAGPAISPTAKSAALSFIKIDYADVLEIKRPHLFLGYPNGIFETLYSLCESVPRAGVARALILEEPLDTARGTIQRPFWRQIVKLFVFSGFKNQLWKYLFLLTE